MNIFQVPCNARTAFPSTDEKEKDKKAQDNRIQNLMKQTSINARMQTANNALHQ